METSEDTGISGFALDTTMDDEFAERHKAVELNPERKLMYAVLEDAIHNATHIESRDCLNARDWIEAVSDDLFSFSNICEIFGLSADYTRRGIMGKPAYSEPARYARQDIFRGPGNFSRPPAKKKIAVLVRKKKKAQAA